MHLTPLVGAEPIDVLENVLLFVPLGVSLALLVRMRSARRVMLTGFMLSLVTETTQLVLDVAVSTGRAADVNDLLGNTIGTAAGFALFRLSWCVAPLARLNTAVTWPSPSRVSSPDQPARPILRPPPLRPLRWIWLVPS